MFNQKKLKKKSGLSTIDRCEITADQHHFNKEDNDSIIESKLSEFPEELRIKVKNLINKGSINVINTYLTPKFTNEFYNLIKFCQDNDDETINNALKLMDKFKYSRRTLNELLLDIALNWSELSKDIAGIESLKIDSSLSGELFFYDSSIDKPLIKYELSQSIGLEGAELNEASSKVLDYVKSFGRNTNYGMISAGIAMYLSDNGYEEKVGKYSKLGRFFLENGVYSEKKIFDSDLNDDLIIMNRDEVKDDKDYWSRIAQDAFNYLKDKKLIDDEITLDEVINDALCLKKISPRMSKKECINAGIYLSLMNNEEARDYFIYQKALKDAKKVLIRAKEYKGLIFANTINNQLLTFNKDEVPNEESLMMRIIEAELMDLGYSKDNINNLKDKVLMKAIELKESDNKFRMNQYISAGIVATCRGEYSCPISIHAHYNNCKKLLNELKVKLNYDHKEIYTNTVKKLCSKLNTSDEVIKECLRIYDKIKGAGNNANSLAAGAIYLISKKNGELRSQESIALTAKLCSYTIGSHSRAIMELIKE